MIKRLALCAVTASVLLAPAGARADELTGRLMVTMDDQAPRTAKASALAIAGAKRAGHSVPQLGEVTVSPLAGRTLAQTAKALRRRPGVAKVQLERRAKPRFVPNDPALSGLEGAPGTPADTPVQWWAKRTNLFTAWDVTRGDTAKVAVIDTGADATHPELQGKIAGMFNFDSANGQPASVDPSGHGTHVSSLACGAGDDGVSIVGAGLNCKLLIFKSDLSDGSVAASIMEAVNQGAQAINMSFGTDGTQAVPQGLRDAIDFAVARNVVLVAAAADSPVEENGDPANILQPTGTGPDLGNAAIRGLSVTASNFADQRASFAGRGSQVSLAAPGFFADQGGPPGILAAFPGYKTSLETGSLLGDPPCGCRGAFANDTRYAYLAGTSMAAPMVAATAALMREANPDLTALEVVRMIKERASRPAGAGWNAEVGFGILNAGNAVVAAAAIDRRAPSSKLSGPKRVRKARKVTVRWKGADTAFAKTRPTGIAKYEVYRSAGRRKYARIATTAATKRRLKVKAGQRYRFYTIAVDKAGNREAAPAKPDLTVRVAKRKRR